MTTFLVIVVGVYMFYKIVEIIKHAIYDSVKRGLVESKKGMIFNDFDEFEEHERKEEERQWWKRIRSKE